jgi:hypothetical protein
MAKLPWYFKKIDEPVRNHGYLVQNYKVHWLYRLYLLFKKGKYGSATEVKDCTLPWLDIEQQLELKHAISQVLFGAYAPGNGGWRSDFGPATMSTLIKYGDFDMTKRKIHEKG